jgi:2-C-methyl-D-erythritol 4-phosphate cytidylyltransferase
VDLEDRKKTAAIFVINEDVNQGSRLEDSFASLTQWVPLFYDFCSDLMVTLPQRLMTSLTQELITLPCRFVACEGNSGESLLKVLPQINGETLVVHEVGRALPAKTHIQNALATTQHHKIVVSTAPVSADGDLVRLSGDQVRTTVSSDNLVSLQTPQIFDRDTLMGVLDRSKDEFWRNDGVISLCLKAGEPVHWINQDPKNSD